MFARVGICIAATSFTSTSAARIKYANIANIQKTEIAETEDSEAGQPSHTDGIRETEVRHCALYHFQSFQQIADDCEDATSSEDAMAEALQHYSVEDATLPMSRNDALSLMTMNTSETFVGAICGEGQPVPACVQSLPPILWLRQFWRFQDLSAHAALPAEDQVKARIINRALSNFGISASRLHSRCERDVESPAFEIVRECVVDSLQAWAANHTVDDITVGEDHALVRLSDPEVLVAQLDIWFRSMWERDDMIRGLHHSAGYFMRSRCSAARVQFEQERHEYEASILATGFPVWHGVTQECNDETPSQLVASGTLERIIQEMSVCAMNNGTCTTEGTPCPEGFSCDCQRREREGSGQMAGLVIGGIAGLAVSTALPFAVAGAAGLAFAPESAAIWAYGSLALGGKAEAAGFGAAAGTLEMSTTCMCFPVECEYNEELEMCEMAPSATASPSSNPFSTLPFTGLKCTEHTSHHWFHSGKECALTDCDHIDASHAGPVIGGLQFFGRVGRSSDWEETGLYNCANTQGTVETLLTRLPSLPQVRFLPEVDNSVENRIQILQQYQ